MKRKTRPARFATRQWGQKVKITVEKNGKRESWIAGALMEKQVKRAIKDYQKGKIYRREVHEKARAYMAGRKSTEWKRLFVRVARREKIAKALPFMERAMPLGRFTDSAIRGKRPIYESLAGKLKQSRKDVLQLMLENHKKIDRGLTYKIRPLSKQGEPRGDIVCQGTGPESVSAMLEHIKYLAEGNALPEYLGNDESKELIWHGIPQRARVKLEFTNGKPSELNGNLGGFSVSITFTRPW